MKRRRFLTRAGLGATGIAAFAGCTGGPNGDGNRNGDGGSTPADGGTTGTDGAETSTDGTATGTATTSGPSGTLRIATYSSFTGEGAAGNWLKSAFESDNPGVTVEFSTPQNGVNQFIQRKLQGAPIGADLYVGINTGELVRADQQLSDPLFAVSEDQLANADAVKDSLVIDPEGRAIPYDTGYICLVYDAEEVENPGSFDALLEPEYEGDLITENAQQSDPGRAFLLWTIIEKGEDGYLDYWSALLDNGVKVLSDWEPAYQAYTNGEAPMVVSYSTDQVYYHGEGVDMSKHQVGFLSDQGYANPEAMAVFEGAENAELGRRFMDFVLTEEAQAEIAVRNVQFPAVAGVDPGGEFSKYAYEPPEPVTFTYDDLAGELSGWVEAWSRQVASR